MVDKEKRQKRFQQKNRHINRQVELKLTHWWWSDPNLKIEPHRYHKVKSLNCGDPKCVMCMNPRKAFGEKTMQERKFECEGVDYDM